MSDELRQLSADEADEDEAWIRETDDPDLRNLEAMRDGNQWQVVVPMGEFVRQEPLEDELRQRMDAALKQVRGVRDVVQQDREAWVVWGKADGRDLLGAAASVVDQLAPRVAAELEEE